MALPQPRIELPSEREAERRYAAPYASAALPLYAGDRGPANELIAALSIAIAQEWAFDDMHDTGEARWPLVKTFLVLGAAGSFCWMLIGVAAYLIF